MMSGISRATMSRPLFRLPLLLQEVLGSFELTAAARGQTSPAAVDEVLNHADGRAKALGRDIFPRHRAGDLRRRSGEGARRWMRRIRLDGSDPAALRTRFGHGGPPMHISTPVLAARQSRSEERRVGEEG